MVQKRKRNKTAKKRGKRTFGYGSHKKHRGGGSRGGRGMAGSKRQKKTWIVKYKPDHLGKLGFKSLEQRGYRPMAKAINVGDIARLAAGRKEIDVSELGYSRVLGRGRLESPLTIRADYFTSQARQKIEQAKGKAVLLSGQEEEKSSEETGE